MSNRIEEKKELEDITERFLSYVNRVRQLKEQTSVQGFYQSIESLEAEVKSLRWSYENQISHLRSTVDNLIREKTDLQQENVDMKSREGHALQRLAAESNRYSTLERELRHLRGDLADRSTRSEEAESALCRSEREAVDLRQQLTASQRKIEQLQYELTQTENNHRDTETKLRSLADEMSYNAQFQQDRIEDLQKRLDEALSQQTSQPVKHSEVDLDEIMQRISIKMEEKSSRWKEAEAKKYENSLLLIQKQLDDEARSSKQLLFENNQLKAQVLLLRQSETNLQAQLNRTEKQRALLESTLLEEQSKCKALTGGLETRVSQLQAALSSAVRHRETDSPADLRAQLRALRTLVEEEEKRLSVESAGVTDHHVASDSQNNFLLYRTVGLKDLSGDLADTQANTDNHQNGSLGGVYQTYSSEKRDEVFASDPPSRGLPITTCTFPTSSYDPKCTLSADSYDLNACTTNVSSFERNSSNQFQYAHTDQHRSTNQVVQQTSANPVAVTQTVKRPFSSHAIGGVRNQNDIRQGSGPTPELILGRESVSAPHNSAVGPLVRTSSVGPIRPHSAPKILARPRSALVEKFIPRGLGDGPDYFEEMFCSEKSEGQWTEYEGQPSFNSSAVGTLKIVEVNKDGDNVKIGNFCDSSEVDIGNYSIVQNVGGHPIAIYRFPPRTKLGPSCITTVWAGSVVPHVADPSSPDHFLWPELECWRTGPECTTVLCNTAGKAISWTTATHRFTKNAFDSTPPRSADRTPNSRRQERYTEKVLIERKQEWRSDPKSPDNGHDQGTLSARMEKGPHALKGYPTASSAPAQNLSRSTSASGDRSRPASGSRVRHASPSPARRVFRYLPTGQQKGRAIFNKAPEVVLRSCMEPPSPFQKPRARQSHGIIQIQSLIDWEYQPPLPHPPTKS